MKNSTKIISFVAALMVFAGSVFSVANAKVDLQAPQEKYAAAKTAYQNAINAYKTTRQQYLTAKNNYEKFKNSTNKKAYEAQTREYLKKTVDVLVNKLGFLKVYVSNSTTLSESEKTEIIAEIDADIASLNQMKAGIDTASPEQFPAKAKEIRGYWEKHRIFVKKVTGQLWNSMVSFAINGAENVSVKIDAEIQKLKSAGRDTAQLELWMSDFNQKIDAAKEKNELARSKFEAIDSLSDMDQLFKEGHQFILEANDYIINANAALVKIVKEMKGAAQASPVPTPTLTPSPTPEA